jgi:hypothetical protein
LDFRSGIVQDFKIVFGETNTEDNEGFGDESFAERWGWFGVMYRLTNGEIVNLERITKLPLLECLTWLSYETDLNETQKVKTNVHTK